MRLVSFCFFFFTLICLSFAQLADSSALDSLPLYKANPVIVNATRSARPILQTPYAIKSFTITKLQQGKKLVSLEETLQSVPGLSVNNRYNFALGDRISIRGLGARSSFGVRGIKILVDDIPLTMPDGQTQLTNLDLGSAGKMEIIKGPSSSLYGNASGGIIKIETEEAALESFSLTPQIIFGSYDFLHLQSKLKGSYEQNNYIINITKLKNSGFRENSAIEYWSANIVNHYYYSDKLKISGIINFYDSPYALNPSSLSREDAENNRNSSRYFVKQQGSGEKTRHGQAGVTLNYKSSNTGQFKITLYGLGRTLKNPIPSRIIELDRLAAGLRMNYSDALILSGKDLSWSAGIDVEMQSDKRKEFDNSGLASNLVNNIKNSEVLNQIEYGEILQHQDEQVYAVGPFANFNYKLSKEWIFSFGSRYDHYIFKVKDQYLADGSDDTGRIKMQQLSPMTGLVYMFHPTRSIYFNYSTAFQTPTTSELGNNPSGLDGLNSNLKPENINNYELGYKGFLTDHKIYVQSALYIMQIKNMLIPFQSSVSEEIFYRNAGSSQNLGLELWLDWNINNAFAFQLSYSLMDFIFTDYTITNPSSADGDKINLKNNKIPGITPQKFYTSLTYNHPTDFFSTIELKWTDAYFTNDFNGSPEGDNVAQDNYINEEALIINLRLGKNWSLNFLDLQIFMGIDNLFNTLYNNSVVPNALNNNYFEPAPGITWYSGIKVIL